MNASSWPMFLLRTLNGAEMAPGTAFKKVISFFKNPSLRSQGTETYAAVAGTSEAQSEQLQARHEAGSCGQEEPVPHLPGHHRRGEGRRGLHHVRRLARRLRLLVQVRLAWHLPRRLVFPHQAQPPATRQQWYVCASRWQHIHSEASGRWFLFDSRKSLPRALASANNFQPLWLHKSWPFGGNSHNQIKFSQSYSEYLSDIAHCRSYFLFCDAWLQCVLNLQLVSQASLHKDVIKTSLVHCCYFILTCIISL